MARRHVPRALRLRMCAQIVGTPRVTFEGMQMSKIDPELILRVRRAESQAEVLRGFAETHYAAKSWDHP